MALIYRLLSDLRVHAVILVLAFELSRSRQMFRSFTNGENMDKSFGYGRHVAIIKWILPEQNSRLPSFPFYFLRPKRATLALTR